MKCKLDRHMRSREKKKKKERKINAEMNTHKCNFDHRRPYGLVAKCAKIQWFSEFLIITCTFYERDTV